MKNIYVQKGKIGRFVWAVILLFCSIQLQAQTTVQTDVPSLKEVYINDFNIGCILSYPHIGFASDPKVSGQSPVVAPQGGTLVKYHMNSMTPGNNMKSIYTIDIAGSARAWQSALTQAEKDSIETHPTVQFNANLIAQLNWAERQGFTFRGHTLVWHSQTPAEFFRSGYTATGNRLSKEVMTLRMENYIKEVIRIIHVNWPGVLSAMDVVNEAISDNNGAFRTTGNEWYTTYGDQTYVMKAFELARKYTLLYDEPQIKLYYNDYNTSSASKADGIVRLCKPIYEAGLLDGIGMQEHNSISFPAAQNWISSYNKFYPICSEMAVTEIDVTTNSGTNTPSASILANHANQYAMLFKCFVERSYKSGRGKIISVTKDGLNDQYTFVTNQSSSLWDVNYQCKPAFFAVAEVGKYYNELDTLISYTEKLDKSIYSAEQQTGITTALNNAKDAFTRTYSASVSAPTTMGTAIANLKVAIGLQSTAVDGVEVKMNTYAYIRNGTLHIQNVPSGASIQVYSLNGSMLQSQLSADTHVTMAYLMPCIIRVNYGGRVTTLKVVQ